jgi:hypothetical protein
LGVLPWLTLAGLAAAAAAAACNRGADGARGEDVASFWESRGAEARRETCGGEFLPDAALETLDIGADRLETSPPDSLPPDPGSSEMPPEHRDEELFAGPPDACGNDACEQWENCDSCPGDCWYCQSFCGDGICSHKENSENCPYDCKACEFECGNGTCETECGESCAVCSKDCGQCSGDCCKPQAAPGCESPAVLACVCQQDAYCCDVAWDLVCAAEAEQLGCADCPA